MTFVCPCIVIIIVIEDQQDATILVYLFIPNQLYMFRMKLLTNVSGSLPVAFVRAKQTKNNPEILHNTATALQAERHGFSSSRQRQETFPFHCIQAESCFYTALHPMLNREYFPNVSRQKCKSDHSLVSSLKTKHAWTCINTPP